MQRQLLLLDQDGNVSTRDTEIILNRIRCEAGEPRLPLPPDHNGTVNIGRRAFGEDVRHRVAQRRHTRSNSMGQRYVLSELRALFNQDEHRDLRNQISELENIFRLSLPSAARRELNRIRRDGVTGRKLVLILKDVYAAQDLGRLLNRAPVDSDEMVPRIVCSEALLND